jgi:hypothetical protein
MTIRKYSSRSQQTTLSENLSSSATEATVISAATLLGGTVINAGQTFTVAIDPDTALEEIVDITATASNTLTIVRGRDGSPGTAHSAGASVRHMAVGRDYRESNLHIEATGAYNDGTSTHSLHGLGSSDGELVGTDKAQTLTAKTLTTPTIASFTNATHSHLNSAGGGQITAAAISDLQEVVEDTVGAMVSSNTEDGISVTYNDSTGKYNFNVNDPVITIHGDVEGFATMTNLGDTTINVGIATGVIVNADVNASAAIAKTKLDLGGTITSADLVDGTIVNADINASAGIALSKLAVDPLARANHTGTQTASTISNFDTQVRTSRLDQMAAPTAAVSLNSQKITNLANAVDNGDAVSLGYLTSQKGVANGIAELDGSGLVPTHHLPALAITTTQVVNSQANMLALTAQVGDVAVRTDVNKSFILTATPASTLGNWQELLTPTDAVLSVDGSTGAVSLSGTYINRTTGQLLGNLDANTHTVTGLGTPTNNTDAATKAYVDTVAGSATAAAASAAAAATSYDNFDDRYLGAKSTPPTLDNDGNALITGAIYWNSVSNAMFAWNGSAWASISSTADIYRYRYTATGGETTESGLDDNGLTLSYIPGKEQVYLNGVLLVRTTDYNATSGTSITGLSALTAGDILEVITFTPFEVANVIGNSLFDAKGDILVATSADTPGKLTVGTDGYFLKADSSTATGLIWSAVDLSSYATIATENDNTIMNIMGAY